MSRVRPGPTSEGIRSDFISARTAAGCVAYWRALEAKQEGRGRIAVNLRLTEPEAVADLPVNHFDVLDKWEDLPRNGQCVRDLWF